MGDCVERCSIIYNQLVWTKTSIYVDDFQVSTITNTNYEIHPLSAASTSRSHEAHVVHTWADAPKENHRCEHATPVQAYYHLTSYGR